MDKRTIARIVYDIKTKEPKISYAKMANSLLEDYGVKISRQALRNIYVREVENMKSLVSSESMIITYIVNLYCFGYDMDEIIKAIRAEFGCNIDEDYIDGVLQSESDYIQDCMNGIRKEIMDYLDDKIAPTKQIRIGKYKIKTDRVKEIAANEIIDEIIGFVKKSVTHASKVYGTKKLILEGLKEFTENELSSMKNGEDTKE